MTSTNKKHSLSVTITNFGRFRKATIDKKEITREQLYTLIGINEFSPFRLEKYINDFQVKNTKHFNIEVWPSDVS